MVPIVVTSIVCFTALLIAGIWKANQAEQRAHVKELSSVTHAELPGRQVYHP
jgi:hypothetical protein